MDAPLNDLYRSADPFEVRSADDGRMTLFGHFSVFNRWTEINSVYEGRFLERIAPGAFRKTLSENGTNAKIMFNHGRSEVLPDVIIAKPILAREDEIGAYYEADLFRGLPEWLYEGLRENVYGASFKFFTVRDKWDDNPTRSEQNPDGLPERTVIEAKAPEWGPVSWPAYADATSGVRSLSDRFHDLGTSPERAALVAPAPHDAAASTITDAPPVVAPVGLTPAERQAAIRAFSL